MKTAALTASARRELGRWGRAAAAVVMRADPRSAPIRDAWVFGGSVGAHYGDNSAALHRHVRRHWPGRATIWAINRDSPDVAAAAAVGPVVFRDDVAAVVAAIDADVHVISHGIHDVPGADLPWSRALKVRLGHGLTAMKRTKAPPLRTIHGVNQSWGLVPVSGPFERENKRAWGIPDDRLVVTGVARFDDLVARAAVAPPQRRILYMPTWRDWIPARAGAHGGRFFDEVAGLLRSKRLHAWLTRHDHVLEVFLHRLLHAHVAAVGGVVDSDRVVVLPPSADVQHHLAGARALLTDYSSVTWDMLYLDRPVAFFHFDVDEYERDRGAYFDLRCDLPGPRANSADEVVDVLDELAAGDFALSADARRWQGRAFAFRDTDNCARIVRAIHERR